MNSLSASAPASVSHDPSATAPTAPSAFETYVNGLTHDWLRILAALGFVLVPLFFVLDTVTMPSEYLPRFGLYRAVGTFASLAIFFALRQTKPSPYSFLYGYLFSFVVGGMIVLMTVDLGGFDSAYYAGLILVIVAANLLLPWRALHSAINGGIILLAYVGANAFFGGVFRTEILINNLYFLSSVVIIAVAISYTKHALIEKEFKLRAELLEVNASLDRSRNELAAARDALWGEMEVAKRIQTALLPPDRAVGGWEAAAVMQTADEVGGDYYDFFETRAGEAWAAIGDVSGHGVESGLVMMMTEASFVSLVNDQPNRAPSDVFHQVNGVIRQNLSRLASNRYMTLSLFRLHPDRFTIAGKHQDVLIWRHATRKVETVVNDGSWIGILPDTRGLVGDLDVPVAKGDVVLLFTDGVTEATSAAGELYGQERLEAALERLAEQPLDVALKTLLTDVERFAPSRDDDRTVMLLRRAA